MRSSYKINVNTLSSYKLDSVSWGSDTDEEDFNLSVLLSPSSLVTSLK